MVYEARRRQKEADTMKYNKWVEQVVHLLGSHVILHQKNPGKLQPRWRGPFTVHSYGSERHLSYLLSQISESLNKGNFHGDDLKKFVLRHGFLTDP